VLVKEGHSSRCQRSVLLDLEPGIHGEEYQEEQTVGSVTSGLLSPTLNTPIGMAYVPTELSKIGSTFLVQVRKRRLAAAVVALPFYHISRST
jgi:glycine cleavage system aminomethyltransferase T